MQSFVEQVVRDVQHGRTRTVLLAGLFALGLYLWIPPFYQALLGPRRSAETVEAVQSASPAPIVAETSFTDAGTKLRGDRNTMAKKNGDRRTATRDPLVQSAEVAAIGSEVFRSGDGSIAAPKLLEEAFANEPGEVMPTCATVTNEPAPLGGGLELKSTIIGVSRRAAYINRKLYFEGTTIEDGGMTYELTAVHPDKVVLKQGNRTIELTVARQAPVTAAKPNNSNTDETRIR